MTDATDVVRTRRIEVVDDRGRMRIVLGMLGVGETEIFGLRVHDERGCARAWVLHDGPVAEVGLDHDGNTVAALTVSDGGAAALYTADDA